MRVYVRYRAFSVAVLPLAALATPVAAEDFSFRPVEQAAPTDWIVTLGADVRGTPHYMGSSREIPALSPYYDRHRPGTPENFHSARDGTGIPLFDNGTIVAGPVGSLLFPRRQDANPALHGLGDVGATLQLGGYMDYWAARWLRLRVEGMQGFGAANGLTANFAMDAVMPVSPSVTLSGGVRARADTAAAERPYFSINQAQSNLSGLPTYDASGGWQAVGLGTQARYRIDSRWATYSFIEYDKLVGSTANSPIVSGPGGSTNQWTFGVGLTYSFAMGGLPF
jgi:outer membrane protein